MVSYYVYYTVVLEYFSNPPRFKFPRFSSLYQAISHVALLTACHFAETRIILIPVDIDVDIMETLMFCTCRYTCALRITFSSEHIIEVPTAKVMFPSLRC